MTTSQITENAKAILLSCGRFGAGDSPPAGASEAQFAIRQFLRRLLYGRMNGGQASGQ